MQRWDERRYEIACVKKRVSVDCLRAIGPIWAREPRTKPAMGRRRNRQQAPNSEKPPRAHGTIPKFRAGAGVDSNHAPLRFATAKGGRSLRKSYPVFPPWYYYGIGGSLRHKPGVTR